MNQYGGITAHDHPVESLPLIAAGVTSASYATLSELVALPKSMLPTSQSVNKDPIGLLMCLVGAKKNMEKLGHVTSMTGSTTGFH